MYIKFQECYIYCAEKIGYNDLVLHRGCALGSGAYVV